MSDVMDLLVKIGAGLGAAFGTGGVGYAIVQAIIKRGDKETQANAAKILTSVASDMVKDLRNENLELRKDKLGLRKELRSFRKAVDGLLDILDETMPLLQKEHMVNAELKIVIVSDLRQALKVVKDQMI